MLVPGREGAGLPRLCAGRGTRLRPRLWLCSGGRLFELCSDGWDGRKLARSGDLKLARKKRHLLSASQEFPAAITGRTSSDFPPPRKSRLVEVRPGRFCPPERNRLGRTILLFLAEADFETFYQIDENAFIGCCQSVPDERNRAS